MPLAVGVPPPTAHNNRMKWLSNNAASTTVQTNHYDLTHKQHITNEWNKCATMQPATQHRQTCTNTFGVLFLDKQTKTKLVVILVGDKSEAFIGSLKLEPFIKLRGGYPPLGASLPQVAVPAQKKILLVSCQTSWTNNIVLRFSLVLNLLNIMTYLLRNAVFLIAFVLPFCSFLYL